VFPCWTQSRGTSCGFLKWKPESGFGGEGFVPVLCAKGFAKKIFPAVFCVPEMGFSRPVFEPCGRTRVNEFSGIKNARKAFAGLHGFTNSPREIRRGLGNEFALIFLPAPFLGF